MNTKLMLLGAASALLVSFACGCAAEMATDEGNSTDSKAGQAPVEEKTGTTQSPLIYGNPAGYNPPGYNPYAPGLNPPGYNPPGAGVGVTYPGYGGLGYGVGYPGWGGTDLNGGWNNPGPY